MSIELIRMKNPDKVIRDIHDVKFTEFGNVLNIEKNYIDEIVKYVEDDLLRPEIGSEYIVNIEEMHTFPIMKKIKHDIYGEMDIECGICHGHNDTLMGLEFHQGSEVNIVVSDFILAIARKEQMKNQKIYSDQLTLFYVPKGSVVELYDKTLHYCPFSSEDNGFSCIVVLLDKTNTTIDYHPNEILVKRNKWFIAHEDNKAKIEAGNVIGLLGEALKIKV